MSAESASLPIVELLVAYLTFTAVLVITPGATTAVVVRNTLMGGRAAGIAAALGAAAASSSHATAAALALTVVLARAQIVLTMVRLAGAAYLAWLGGVSVYRAIKEADGGWRLDEDADVSTARARRGGFRQGLITNLLNPTIASFYLAVVPSFMPAGAPLWYFAVLAAIHIVMALICHCSWAVALHHVRRMFRSPRARRALEAITGGALILLAVRVFRS